MTDVLFGQSYFLRFDPKLHRLMQPYPPLGSLIAAAVLRDRGYEVGFFDAMLADSEAEWVTALDARRPRCAVLYEDSFNYLSKMCLLRMREAAYVMLDAARRRGCTTLVCGSDASDHPEAYLAHGADVVLIGEGEQTLHALVDCLGRHAPPDLAKIAGIAFAPRAADGIVRTLPRPVMRESTLRELAATCAPSDRIRVVPLGVDTTRFRPEAATNGHTALTGAPALLTVASLSAVKDQVTLLDAFALAIDRLPRAHLHVVGEGSARHALDRRVERLRLRTRVTFHGAVSHDQLSAYYRAADVCVLSSRFESQGMVVLEAAACGRRTIGTRVGVLPEITGAAATVPTQDPPALADLIATQLDRPDALPLAPPLTADELAAAYGLRPCVTRFCDLYRSLAHPEHRPQARSHDLGSD